MSSPDCTRHLSPRAPALRGRPRRLGWRAAGVATPVLVLAALGCQESADSPVAPGASAPEASAELATLATSPLTFIQVSTGINHTCGVAADNRAYCWGENERGALGDGTTTDRLAPHAVAGGLRFRTVSAGWSYTCGLTTDDRAYCWGDNVWGTLGDGSNVFTRLKPVPVAGGRRYRQLRAGYHHSCGVTLAEVTFCWGDNGSGQLGIGFASSTTAPVRVKTALVFRHVVVGGGQTCGLTADNVAWCWGNNTEGQLGDGTQNPGWAPVAVAGGHAFIQLTGGLNHTCGVTSQNVAYCWGQNYAGGLGDGTQTTRLAPVAVAGGLRFRGVSAGFAHTCGVTLGNEAYCWGYNKEGQQGDGTFGYQNFRVVPKVVAGGHAFRAVGGMVGSAHTCGVTPIGRAWCWGDNSKGQLGDGTTTRRARPAAVVGPL
jgi:alpha-tubulin suppressor-like RCC1 family protein